MKITKALAIAAAILVATAAFAQNGPGGGGRQGGFGGGQFGRGGFGGPGGFNPSQLLQREDVQTELKISDDQKSKLTEIRDAQRTEMRAAFQDLQGGGGAPDREAMGKLFEKLNAKTEAKIKEVLTADQAKRLKELAVQRAGNAVILNKDIQTELGVTDAQKSKIKELQDGQQKATQALMTSMRNGDLDRDEMRAKMEKNTKILGEELGKLLTDAQKAKIKEMSGAAFTFKEESNN